MKNTGRFAAIVDVNDATSPRRRAVVTTFDVYKRAVPHHQSLVPRNRTEPGGVDEALRIVGPDSSTASAFERFFDHEYPGAVRLAHLLSGSNTPAEDLAQEAFARVLPHFDRLDNPAAYLRTAIVNACRTWHRSRGREQDRFRRHGASAEVALSAASAELLDSIRRLPYRQQAVLVLRYWLDMSEADIALTLDCRPGTVKSLHSRALDAIRKDLP